jgi:ATP-binding cassette, subfamily B, bacterial PglK
MLNDIRRVLFLLSSKEKKQLFGMAIIILFVALLDMLGVASIFPFLTVLINPEMIHTNDILKWIYFHLGMTSDRKFFLLLGVTTFVILVISSGFRALNIYIIAHFGLNKFYELSKQMMTYYLYESYSFFINRNSADLSDTLVKQVNAVIGGIITPWLRIVTQFFISSFIFILLLLTDPVLTIVSAGVLVGIYFLIYRGLRMKLASSGTEVLNASKKMLQVANETFGGIKEIKLMGKESTFIDQYSKSAKHLAQNDIIRQVMLLMPTIFVEVITFGGLLLMTIYLISVKDNYQDVIPTIGLYAFAARRIVPSLQNIFTDFGGIKFYRAALDNIYGDLINSKNFDRQKHLDSTDNLLAFTKQVELRGLTFQYKNAKEPALKNMSLTIEADTTVGVVGSTGAGKTTAIDIILGLLQPQKGDLLVDCVVVGEANLRQWQANIGYVSQHIYLSDSSILCNIAYGISDHKIDHQAVEHAARLANIHDFIVNDLSDGYETEIGERGIRLSGGQRQRIGIARALYRNPSLLVFDEATSALDGITENIIMEAIHNLSGQKTIIIIAHRLATVRECDVIYMLERGKIKDKNTYQVLIENNEEFRMMAKASS